MEIKFQFKPFGRKLLIEKTGKLNLTEGSSIIQAESINVPLTGIVIEAGDGEWNEMSGQWMETKIKVGERVLFLESAVADIRSHGKDLFLLQENAVLGTY
jgi:co-chaperonin GroES (HSP10)